MKKNKISGKAAPPATDNNSDLNEFDSGTENTQLRYVDFGLRRLVHPGDLEFPNDGETWNPEDVVAAACDNLSLAGQDFQSAGMLTSSSLAKKDVPALTSALCMLAAMSGSVKQMLKVQFEGMIPSVDLVLRGWQRPSSSKPKSIGQKEGVTQKGGSFVHSVSAIIRMGERLEQSSGQFRRDYLDFDCDESTAWKSYDKLELLRSPLPRELKRHVRIILDSPEVRALVPEAGRLSGKPVPLFTRYLKGSAKR